jgi:hypothetical protein
MDPDLVNQLNVGHSRGIAASAGFAEQNNQLMTQLGALIASGNAFDSRMTNGFLANQLFNEGLVQAKSAFHTPVENAAAPLAAPPSK